MLAEALPTYTFLDSLSTQDVQVLLERRLRTFFFLPSPDSPGEFVNQRSKDLGF